MRLAALVLAALTATSLSAAPTKARIVNLNAPGVLQALERDNPDHYRRVSGVLTLARESACQADDFPRIVQAQFSVDRAQCRALIKTSDPAKLDLSFVIEDTMYRSQITMTRAE